MAPLPCHDRTMAWRIDPEGVETRALAQLVQVDGLRVLELGCGNGRLTFRYAANAASVLAVDPDTERITEAREALPSVLADTVTFAVSSAEKLDARHHTFDLALFSSSL
jgi:ubiquinone/menaquinone biosynthesis C-methylase UbiE